MKCPYCDSEEYEIMYSNENRNALYGIAIAFILFIIGGVQSTFTVIAVIVFIASILSLIINNCTKGTLKVRCTKCNQKYKISKGELKK